MVSNCRFCLQTATEDISSTAAAVDSGPATCARTFLQYRQSLRFCLPACANLSTRSLSTVNSFVRLVQVESVKNSVWIRLEFIFVQKEALSSCDSIYSNSKWTIILPDLNLTEVRLICLYFVLITVAPRPQWSRVQFIFNNKIL